MQRLRRLKSWLATFFDELEPEPECIASRERLLGVEDPDQLVDEIDRFEILKKNYVNEANFAYATEVRDRIHEIEKLLPGEKLPPVELEVIRARQELEAISSEALDKFKRRLKDVAPEDVIEYSRGFLDQYNSAEDNLSLRTFAVCERLLMDDEILDNRKLCEVIDRYQQTAAALNKAAILTRDGYRTATKDIEPGLNPQATALFFQQVKHRQGSAFSKERYLEAVKLLLLQEPLTDASRKIVLAGAPLQDWQLKEIQQIRTLFLDYVKRFPDDAATFITSKWGKLDFPEAYLERLKVELLKGKLTSELTTLVDCLPCQLGENQDASVQPKN